jgi:hypothetical protein
MFCPGGINLMENLFRAHHRNACQVPAAVMKSVCNFDGHHELHSLPDTGGSPWTAETAAHPVGPPAALLISAAGWVRGVAGGSG